MHTPAITLQHLSKRYHGAKTLSLNDVSLSVQPGEVYGLLGSNGAGKSTTIRAILNLIQPTKGSITIHGFDSVRQSVQSKRHIGYLAGDIALYHDMTGAQLLAYLQALQPLPDMVYFNELVHQFEADLSKPIRALSKGNRQKVGLIQALMHQPAVLLLDEPTSGLDPLMQEVFYSVIAAVKRRGAAVLVSSHNFSEVQRMCDRVGFLKNGALIAEQTLADLTKQAAHTFGLTFSGNVPLTALKALEGVAVTAHTGKHITIAVQGELTPLFAVLAQARVTSLIPQEVDLEATFLDFYRSKPGSTS